MALSCLIFLEKKMKSDLKFFKNSKILPIDIFLQNVLYDNNYGYYTSKQPFGKNGDFITSPNISSLFSEIIAIWIISVGSFGRPKNLMCGAWSWWWVFKFFWDHLKNFRNLINVKNFYMKSSYLKKLQK